MLPALRTRDFEIIQPVQEQLEERPKFKVVWERIVTVDYYETALSALLPIIDVVGNNDISKVQSCRKGVRKVRLSVIDLWEDKMLPFPSISEAYEMISMGWIEPAGIIDLIIFTKIVREEKVLADKKGFLILAIREYNLLGKEIKAFPSLAKYSTGIVLSLTYDWVIKDHHALFLVVD